MVLITEYKEEVLKKLFPKVTFKIDKDVDKGVAGLFLEEKINPIDFNDHPGLQVAVKHKGTDRQKIINDYVDQYYQTYTTELETARNRFQREWEEIEPVFFDITKRVFESHEWPPGEYTACPSIFNCNPRFLELKMFQIYRKNVVGTVYSTAHEMLHFIFYDYMEKNEKEYVKKLGEGGLWALSEVFNEIALDQPEYSQFKPKVPSSYPHLKPISTKFRDSGVGKPFNITSFITQAKQIHF